MLIWGVLLLIWCIVMMLLFLKVHLGTGILNQNVAIGISYGMILSFIFLLLLGKVQILNPIRRMSQQIDLFNTAITFDELFVEMTGISKKSDFMFAKIQRLIDKEKMLENAKQQARFLALQNQINPHFLYNVLESIRSDAYLAGVPEIGNISEALALYFRYTTSKMENISTLQEELGNIENYFSIQKYRFEDKIELIVKYPTDSKSILKSAIPKLTLQPIVENAIKHGLEPKIEGGKVEIDIEHSKRNVYISIRDNGVGIDEGKLKKLNETLRGMDSGTTSCEESGKGGIALINVNTRIRLLMGEEYGVHMFSTPGIGTEIRLILPYLLETSQGESRHET